MNDLFIEVDLTVIELRKCQRCGYEGSRVPIDEHHITYRPEKKVHLCRPCHIGITVINGTYAQLYRNQIDNKDRAMLFRKFMKCGWRMEDEKEPIVKLRRRRDMVYRNRLKKLQKEFFGGNKDE